MNLVAAACQYLGEQLPLCGVILDEQRMCG